jgi:hypothetical protein
MAYENHWLPGFNFNVEEWDAKGQTYETLAICRSARLRPRRVRGRGEARVARLLGGSEVAQALCR